MVGTVIRRVDLLRAGGFEEWPIYEDWEAWLRCRMLGLEPVPWEWDRFVTHHASITRLSTMEMRDGYTFALNRLSDVEHLPRDARTL